MIGLAVAALLVMQDPVGDTTGNGTLSPPTATIYQSRSPFDVTAIELLDTPTLGIKLTLDSLANPLELPLGFSFPIIEFYLSDATSGNEALLPGSGMRLPDGASWHYAFQISGEALKVFVAEEGTMLELSSAGDVRIDGDSLLLETSLPRPDTFTLFGMVGQYTPFSATGWQPLSLSPSPWAFSSQTQTYPVIDVISAREDLQERALQTGVLPGLRRTSTTDLGFTFNTWIGLMGLGLLTTLIGIVGRFTLHRTPAPPRRAYAPVQDSVATAPPEPSPPGRTMRPQTRGHIFEDEDTPSGSAIIGSQGEPYLTGTADDATERSDTTAQGAVLNEKGWLEIDSDAEVLANWETFDEPSFEDLEDPQQLPFLPNDVEETLDKP